MIVRPVDVDTGDATEGVQRRSNTGQPLCVPEVVTGVHDQVGTKLLGKTREPALFSTLPRRHVDVGEVEDPERRGPGRQDAYVMTSHSVEVAFDADSPYSGADTDRPHDPKGREGGARER